MTKQARTTRVFLSLMASMTVGAMVLMALDNKSISKGPWSLAGQIQQERIEKDNPLHQMVHVSSNQYRQWNRMEVFYSGTNSSELNRLFTTSGLDGKKDLNFHFSVCNSVDSIDGLIRPNSKWSSQQPCARGGDFHGTDRTLRICVIADGLSSLPTDLQRNRTASLVNVLAAKFNIAPSGIAYPADWRN